MSHSAVYQLVRKEKMVTGVVFHQRRQWYVGHTSLYPCIVVTCWERADLVALVGDVCCIVVTFPSDILGQVWYLIISFPDPSYFPIFLYMISNRNQIFNP